MIFSAKDKKIFKEILDKEFPLTGKDLFQIIIVICIVFIFSELLADKICELLTTKDETLLGSKIRVKFACLVVLISTIAFYIFLARKDYVPSKKLLFFTFLTGIVAYQTTLFNQQFFFAFFVYVVILFLCQLHLLIAHLDWQYQIKKATQIKKQHESKTKIIKGFYLDTSLKDPKNDKKGYYNYAKNIANKIKETHHDEAFAIGINGKWGSGKTTMSNFIEEHIGKTKDIVTIDFKPWNSNTPDAIIKDFFETLQDELSQYHAALSRLLIRYSRKLTSIDSNIITQTIEYAANYILDLDATNKVYDKINKALKDINKKIIIYIDDLDRLEQSEIMEVIRLIRNTANFYNTFFIVTYDKAYVNNALEDAKIHNHKKFLEKIFQLEVDLPYYKKYELIKELHDKLKKLFPDKITKDIEKEIFKESSLYDDNILDDWLENSRDVTRLCNSFMLNYSSVKDYVVFKEFLLIEVLRINYPSIYYDLCSRRKDFFDRKQDIYKFKKIKGETIPLEKYLEDKFETNNEKIYSFIRDIFYIDDLHDTELQNNNQDSIIRSKRFYIYFNYANFDKVLAYQEFEDAYNSDEEYFFEKIEEWIDKKLGIEVSERLGSINKFNTKHDLEKYARALILFYDLFKSYKTIEYFRYKINNKELIEEYYDGSSEKMIESIFQPFSKNDIRRKLEFIESFDKEEIVIFQNTFLNLFDTLIENSNKFNYAMSDCVRIAYKIPEIKDLTIERIKKFILEKDHLRGFLLSTLCLNCLGRYSKDHINNKYIEILYANLSEFEELLLSIKEGSEYVKEYLDFYNDCKQSNFKEEYKFDFPYHHFPEIEEWEKVYSS